MLLKIVLIRSVLVVSLLLAQSLSAVHAYEHHDDLDIEHACEICLAVINLDGDKTVDQGIGRFETNINLVPKQCFNLHLTKHSNSLQARAPPFKS